MERNKNEWVIHVWGKNRDNLELTSVEKFHIDMLNKLHSQQRKFDKILVNIALDDINNTKLFELLKKEISSAIDNDNIEFKVCQNISDQGELVTFKPYVFDRIGENVNIFYSHFKGYRSYLSIRRESFPSRVADLCEMFWSYMMYMYSMDFEDVQEKFNSGKSIYCWYIVKNGLELDYFSKYQICLRKANREYVNYTADGLGKHSPGSFLWYNMKQLGESLKDKSIVKDVTSDFLIKGSDSELANLSTHFCELYLLQFLSEDECYSVKEFKQILGTLYVNLYPSKKIGRDLMDDFNKYLIEKELI